MGESTYSEDKAILNEKFPGRMAINIVSAEFATTIVCDDRNSILCTNTTEESFQNPMNRHEVV